MGGKEAKERRRLARLALQQAATSSGGGRANHEASKSATSAGTKDAAATEGRAEKKKSIASNRNHHDGHSQTKGKFNSNKRRSSNADTNNSTNKNNKKKIKKPKHLKRKLEQLSAGGGPDEEKERARLQQQMRQLDENKAERAKRFETKIRKLAGNDFDQGVFDELRSKGASVSTIMEAVVERKKKIIRTKDHRDGNDKKSSNNKRKMNDKKNDATPTTMIIEENKPLAGGNDSDQIEEGNTSTDMNVGDAASKTYSTVPDSNGSIDDIESISDEECDVYILDPEEVEKKKKDQLQQQKKNKKLRASSNEVQSDSSSDVASSSEDSDDSDSSSDDNDSLQEQKPERVRGRRRRGRKDADTKREVVNIAVKEELEEKKKAEKDESPVPDKTKKRRCIGRKPVTDFIVGQKYDGEVVYVKPFGAFIDIGCHSDAFCHISRVADDFVETIGDILSHGDKVSPRIVEIDRKKKRLTVSLQSESRIADERKSVEARMERVQKNSSKKTVRNTNTDTPPRMIRPSSSPTLKQTAPPTLYSKNAGDAEQASQFDNLESIPESEMTHAQLKRARKLARRAERRKQQEETGIAA
mmetsp:Transcript_23742/g.51430  ORF Transcript_23742/g.51430 Transcript_23742/m.51430 type:complete len:585 (-) Transcript_23742:58-1812(-)